MGPLPEQRFLPLIFDSVTCGLFTVNTSGRITSFNRAAEKLTGHQAKEVVGQPCSSVLQSGLCESRCPLKSSIETGQSREELEVEILSKSRQPLPVAVSTAALKDEQGQTIGGLGIIRDLRELNELRRQMTDHYTFEDIVSKNHRMRQTFEMLPMVADCREAVLIEGETGTGKELLARTIHNLSGFKKTPFAVLNCKAVPNNLLESELFGHLKDTTTGARQNRAGLLAMTDAGTLLLKEVGHLSRTLQVRLVRALREKTIVPPGTTRKCRVQVRVIASVSRDLSRDVSKRRFRQDLYQALGEIHIVLPLLRERREDIPFLVRHFIGRLNSLQGKRITGCSEQALSSLMQYAFPGNVRELENIIEHAFVVCTGQIIRENDLPGKLKARQDTGKDGPVSTGRPLDRAEAQALLAALERCGYNRTRACKELGISRNTLWRKMKRYGIKAPGA